MQWQHAVWGLGYNRCNDDENHDGKGAWPASPLYHHAWSQLLGSLEVPGQKMRLSLRRSSIVDTPKNKRVLGESHPSATGYQAGGISKLKCF